MAGTHVRSANREVMTMSSVDVPLEVLALKPACGSVAKCRDVCIHVTVDKVVLRLGKAEYWTLMEMLSEAARRLAGADTALGSGCGER
jgi:hypothetical protein